MSCVRGSGGLRDAQGCWGVPRASGTSFFTRGTPGARAEGGKCPCFLSCQEKRAHAELSILSLCREWFSRGDLHNPLGITPVFPIEEQFFLAEFKHPPFLFCFFSSRENTQAQAAATALGGSQIPSHSSGTVCCPLNIGVQWNHGVPRLDLFPHFLETLG